MHGSRKSYRCGLAPCRTARLPRQPHVVAKTTLGCSAPAGDTRTALRCRTISRGCRELSARHMHDLETRNLLGDTAAIGDDWLESSPVFPTHVDARYHPA